MKKRKRRGVPRGGSSWRNMKAKQKRPQPQDTDDAPSHQYWWPTDGPSINSAWFYIPLRIPLKLPDGFVLPIGSPYDIDYPQDELTDLIGFAGDPDNPIGVSVSICVHQIEGTASRPEMEAALTAIQRRPESDKPNIDSMNAPIVTTVLECVTSLGDVSPEDIEDALTPAFDKVVGEVNNFLRSYMILTPNRVALVQREALPLGVLAEWRLGHESGPGSREPAIFLVNMFDDLTMSMSARHSKSLSEEEVSEMLTNSDALADPMMAEIHTMTLDARLALQRGDYAVSVVLLASSCELILRLLLEVLLWEDDVSPKDAASEMFRSSNIGHNVSYLLRSKFHDRLGGIWDTTSASNPVGRFDQAVFESRNSYLHAATQITGSDANHAFEAATVFLEFVHERLVAQLHRYPFAASVLIGEPIISQMGIRQKIDTALRDREAELPLSALMYDCREHFNMYRQEVMRYRDSSIRAGAPLVGEMNEQTHVASLIYPDSSIEYWLIDPENAVACRAETPNTSEQQAKHVGRLAKKARRLPSNLLTTCRLMDATARPLASPPNWVPAYEVWRMEHKQS